MANFATHMIGAVGVGVACTALLAATDLISIQAVASGVGMVGLGGIFPDVDSDRSDSIELVFGVLAASLGVPLVIMALPQVGLLGSLSLLVGAYLFVRYVLIHPFRLYTVHRGAFHSVPMALFLGAVCALIGRKGMGMNVVGAWVFAGLFMIGFFTHLALDEMYSVDLGNRRIKRSFGTALKLFNPKDSVRYVVLYAAVAAAFYVAPSLQPVTATLMALDINLLPTPELMAFLGLG